MTTPQTALVVDAAAALAAAEASTVVIWRGRRLQFATLSDHIAALSDRGERNALWLSYLEAEEALNPLRERRMAALAPAVDAEALRAADELAAQVRGFLAESETVYFAALRRHLALVDIEQGDATLADLWHIRSGAGWNHWWEPRRLSGAIGALRTATPGDQGAVGAGDWRAGSDALEGAGRDALGVGADPELAGAVGEAFRTLTADPGWLVEALGMDAGDVPAFADYAAFWRTWEVRNCVALLLYESQLYRTRERGVQRAYYSGILSLLTGVHVPEERYLCDVGEALGSVRAVRGRLLGGMLLEQFRRRHGPRWWAESALAETLRHMSDEPGADAVARLGYDDLDWRPVLRQIRTQLIGEMSGYGGPNITTRAGTRKV